MCFSRIAASLISFILIAFLSSCSNVFYVPSAQNVPLHKEKGELKFSGNRSVSEETEGWNLRSSYSFTDHFAAIASYTSLQDDADSAIGAGSAWRAGLGYYTPLNNTKWIFETYAGFGGGEGYLNRSTSGYIDYQASEFFMQQAIGYSGDFTFVGVSLKTSRLQYFNVKGNTNENYYPLAERPLHYFFEPAITIRLGYKYGYIETQYVHSYTITGTGLPRDVAAVNFGLHLNLGPVISHLRSNPVKNGRP